MKTSKKVLRVEVELDSGYLTLDPRKKKSDDTKRIASNLHYLLDQVDADRIAEVLADNGGLTAPLFTDQDEKVGCVKVVDLIEVKP